MLQTRRKPVLVESALARPGAQTDALRAVMRTLIALDRVNDYLGGMISALDIRYPLGEDHPLLGRRMPDLELRFTW